MRTPSAQIKVLSANPGRIANLSVRAQLDPGGQRMITGFVVNGAGTRPILLRGVGPTLERFRVAGAASDPVIELFAGTTLQDRNDNWGGDVAAAAAQAVFGKVGAFVLPDGSRDAALLRNLNAQSYSLHTLNQGVSTGVVLVEIYDALGVYDANNRITNVSARAKVSSGDGALIAGIVISGDTTCRILARAVGPTLAGFGVADALPDPTLALYAADSTNPIASNDDWAAVEPVIATEGIFGRTGAFTLPSGSKDAVVVSRIMPGAYTLVAQGKGAATGQVLIEIYLLP